MAETSGIAWTRSTFNPWIGCTKVGPGCDHCYAEVLDSRRRWDDGKTHWGAGVPRYRTKASSWNPVKVWNKLAGIERETGVLSAQHIGKWHRPGFWPVFCASLADVFDNEVHPDWRSDLFDLIGATPNLSWLLVTKRIGNVASMAFNWMSKGFPNNVRILITVVNQEEADRDVQKLLELDCKNGISYEPSLGPVDWTKLHMKGAVYLDGLRGQWDGVITEGRFPRRIEWIIGGGESNQGGTNAREHNIEWQRSVIKCCAAAGVPYFGKQLGSNVVDKNGGYWLKSRTGSDMSEWPLDLQVREFPE